MPGVPRQAQLALTAGPTRSPVGSGQRTVDSGQWAVGSGQWYLLDAGKHLRFQSTTLVAPLAGLAQC